MQKQKFQFVLRETPLGQATHDLHLERRAIAVAKADILQVELAQPKPPPDYGVQETQIAGDWCYTWVVYAPDIQTVWALIGEFTHWGNVELYSGPTAVFSAEDVSRIQNLSAQLRKLFPDK